MINLLLKKPHSHEYLQDALLDDEVYADLIAQDWRFAINQAQPNRHYVNMYRFVDGRREQRLLHRHLAFLHHKFGHAYQVHHKDHNGCNNCADNLEPLSPSDHKRLHPSRRVAA